MSISAVPAHLVGLEFSAELPRPEPEQGAATLIISGDDPGAKGTQRFEVFTGLGRRREWSPEVKVSIVAGRYAGAETVSAVARRLRFGPFKLCTWRRDLRRRLETREWPFLPQSRKLRSWQQR